jgi:hypothetical protein
MPTDLLQPSGVTPATGSAVLPTGLTFANVTPTRVRVEIAVSNAGDAPSGPTTLPLSAAPLGAFVPWRPLASLAVPALAPGETRVLRWDATRPAAKPLGPPDRVPPRALLTALGMGDDPPLAGRAALLRRRRLTGGGPQTLASRALPADPLDLLGRPNVHWAGNLNVFVGGRDVERHLAQALRVYPGRTNLACFVVGSGPDAYRFRLEGEGAGWDASLHDLTASGSLLPDRSGEGADPPGEWVEVDRQRLMILALRPPKGCGTGSVEVRVEQRSTGREAVVEFSLDPAAAGPGCYVV